MDQGNSNSNWDDFDDDDGWGDPSNDLDGLDLYGGSSGSKARPKKQPELPAQSIAMAKNDLARAKNNMTSKKQSKNQEADMWDDFGGSSKSNTSNNNDLMSFGNSTSQKSEPNWDAWDEPKKTVQTSNILKPTKAPAGRARGKPKKQADDWGEW